MTTSVTENFVFPENMALFLDFDGTLVDFKNDPETVHLTTAQTILLVHLNTVLSGALAVISGRDVRDLATRIPNTIWRLGNHGLYSAAPSLMPSETISTFPRKLRETLTQAYQSYEGVWMEMKGPMIAIHHRTCPEAGPEIYDIAIAQIKDHSASHPDYIVQTGHNVIEIKPALANKGKALIKQMTLDPFSGRTPIMIGDDTTDEDGFIAAQELGGFGIKIGMAETQAKYRLSDRTALRKLLETIK